MKTAAEIGAVPPQAKGCQGLPAITRARREAWNRLSLRVPLGTNPSNTLISDFPPSEHVSQLIAGEIKHVLCGPTGRSSQKLVPGFPQTLPLVPFFFADFALYPFIVINLSHEYHYMLSPVSPPRDSSSREVVLGEPLTQHNSQEGLRWTMAAQCWHFY